MASGIMRLYSPDTTPGANSPFAPPRGWKGNADDYMAFMRSRYATDFASKQQMYVVAYRMMSDRQIEIIYEGPFKNEAKNIMEAIVSGIRKKAAALAA